jgi:hypothetical protein
MKTAENIISNVGWAVPEMVHKILYRLEGGTFESYRDTTLDEIRPETKYEREKNLN